VNSFAFHDDIVINEIMYHHQPQYKPYQKSDEEWIELYNRSSETVALSGWNFTDGIEFTFPENTLILPHSYLVVAGDAATLASQYPSIDIVGDFSGQLSNGGERIVLIDTNRNPVDEVRYYDGGRWPQYADGGGSSLELRDLGADNSIPEAWAASDESGKTTWKTYSYTMPAAPSSSGPDGQWKEFILGHLTAGEMLLDDVSVLENGSTEFIQNGSFESDPVGEQPATWRIIGNHRYSQVMVDPDNGTNKVLRLVSTGASEHMHNHAETTIAYGRDTVNGQPYTISFRAKWLAGSPWLNSRLYFNRCTKSTAIDFPQNNGTPGMVNSCNDGNIGPTYRSFSHSPAVPNNSEGVTVSAIVEDPDGVGSCNLWWEANEGGWSSESMTAQGSGLYAAHIPPNPSSSIVQFYVEAVDNLGGNSTYPSAGPESRALYKVDDGLAATNGRPNFRIIVTQSDTDWMHYNINVMSDGHIGATVIYNERIVYYDVGVRLKGSSASRPTDLRCGFNLKFNEDKLFCGVHRTVMVDRAESNGFGQREMLINLAMNRAGGVPSKYNNLINVMTPRLVHSGSAELQLARFGDEFLDNQFENGSEGKLFEYELIYYPVKTDNGSPEGNKWVPPHGGAGTDIQDLGDDKEHYRWNFLIKNNRAQDDYTSLVSWAKVYGLSNPTFNEQISEFIDVDQFLRSMAIAVMNGTDDQYGQYVGWYQHNAQFYVRPTDGRMLYFPHDIDHGWQVNRPLIGCLHLPKLIAYPSNERLYYSHAYDILTTAYNRNYMQHSANQFGQLAPEQNFDSHLSFIYQRSNFLLAEIATRVAPEYPFQVTTGDGIVTTATATINGDGWIDVYKVYVDGIGIESPLELTWIHTGFGTNRRFHWQTTVPLDYGMNDLVFRAYNYQNELVGSDSVTIVSTAVERPLEDYLRITELMYNPEGGSDYEFIELCNTGSAALDLSNLVISGGIDFNFSGSGVTSLAAGDYVLVVRNPTVFASRYDTAGMNIAGEYSGNLANEGERIMLVGEFSTELFTFEYDDGRGWSPAADGAGHSLVPLPLARMEEPEGSLDYGGNWRASTYLGGSPGEDDPESPVTVVLNELMMNTDYDSPPYDSNDWIEIYNPGTEPITLHAGQWYLSDDGEVLNKWGLPQTTLEPSAREVFDEVTGFHDPITEGFGLSKAGEQVFLSYLSGTGSDRVVDCLSFEGQEAGISLGRFEDGMPWWYRMIPSNRTANFLPIKDVVIEEIMYHPDTENDEDEYIELYNPTSEPVELWSSAGPWRMAGGIDYKFPMSTTLPPEGRLLLVHFDPTNLTGLDAFKSTYGLSDIDCPILGPYSRTLSNGGERVALEKPMEPTVVTDPLIWVIVDEVIYSDQTPFPAESDGGGFGLNREFSHRSGNDPDNWNAYTPTPGISNASNIARWQIY